MSTSSRRTILLATDQQRSVMNALDATQHHHLAYTPYGHRPGENGLLSLLGFNGELPDPMTGHYPLGNGYRQFNPVLMRFNSPDSWSPFGEGELNAYSYCIGDPVNRIDPTGHSFFTVFKAVMKFRRPLVKTSNISTSATSKKAIELSAGDLPGSSSTAQLLQGTPSVSPPSSTAPPSLKSLQQKKRKEVRLGARQETFHQERVALRAVQDPAPTYKDAQYDAPPPYEEAVRRMNPSDPNYTRAALNAVASSIELPQIRDPERASSLRGNF